MEEKLDFFKAKELAKDNIIVKLDKENVSNYELLLDSFELNLGSRVDKVKLDLEKLELFINTCIIFKYFDKFKDGSLKEFLDKRPISVRMLDTQLSVFTYKNILIGYENGLSFLKKIEEEVKPKKTRKKKEVVS